MFHRHCHGVPVKIWVEWRHPQTHHHHHYFDWFWRDRRMLPNLPIGSFTVGTVFEKDAQGNAFSPPPANITVQSSNGQIISIVNNGDGTVTATGIAPGTAQETIGDSQYPTITDVEQGTVPDVPVSIGVNWGPVQTPPPPAAPKK
jgi:hypothetical protein